MRNYIRALLRSQSLAVGPSADAEAGLRGLAPYYSGTVAVQSFWRLEQELSEAMWVTEEPVGYEREREPLSFFQLEAGALLHAVTASSARAQAVAKQTIGRKGAAQLQGTTAALTEDGYKGVVALRNGAQMKAYVRRILA